jgi:hypothetical protein
MVGIIKLYGNNLPHDEIKFLSFGLRLQQECYKLGRKKLY